MAPLDRSETPAAAHREADLGRSAVIDVGSNSVRMVVFEGPAAAPYPIFNEKASCAIGAKLYSTGKLDPAGVASALRNIRRFLHVGRALNVSAFYPVATAAVREAQDGTTFIKAAKKQLNLTINVLSGREEARLSALGALLGFTHSHGVVADIGGGSLELTPIEHGSPRRGRSLPLGMLRLGEAAAQGVAIDELIEESLRLFAWPEPGEGATVYAVGGAWRALARLHMQQLDYPLRVVDAYGVSAAAMLDFAHIVAQQKGKSLRTFARIDPSRAKTLPLAAQLMAHVIRRANAERVVFSARGLREGLLWSKSPERSRARDPLVAAAKQVALRFGRFPEMGDAVWRWSAPLFSEEGATDRRLRRAACNLGDLGWSGHPDYRAQQAFERVLSLPFPGLDHLSRVFLGAVIWSRHTKHPREDMGRLAFRVGLDAPHLEKARLLGALLRFAHTFCGGNADILTQTKLGRDAKRLQLTLPKAAEPYLGDLVESRFSDVAAVLGLRSKLTVKK